MFPKLTLLQTVKEDDTSVATIAVVLDAALDAYRAGTLDELLRQRPSALRWVTHRFLQPVLGTAGDGLPAERHYPAALELLLKWGITQLRPDRAPELTITDRQAWLERTSWRPAIAVMCHYGFAPVPEFRDRYYRRPDESPADNLCGLWNIGQSTFYRYLDKGKRLMAKLFYEQRLDQRHMLPLRGFIQREVYRQHASWTEPERANWHHRQAEASIRSEDYLSAFWHLRSAHDFDQINKISLRYLTVLSKQPEFDAQWQALPEQSWETHDRIQYLLTTAAIYRIRNDAEQEQVAYEQALRLAVEAKDNLAIGVVYGQLGKFYEPRDADRAFMCYQDSVEHFSQSKTLESNETLSRDVHEAYVSTLVKLAWLYTLRNDPRAKPVLDRAQELRNQAPIPEDTIAMLEQAWGEYCRRAGRFDEALEHRQRALNIYERIGDQEGVIKSYLNLGLVYIDLNRFDSASNCFTRVLDVAETTQISTELLASAHLNLGVSLYWQHRLDEAIDHYRRVLAISEPSKLTLWLGRGHHNLAEAYYKRFFETADPDDEQQGDLHAAAAVSAWRQENAPAFVEATQRLKAEVLAGALKDRTDDRFLPQETAAHYSEMAEVEKHRAALAAPGKPEDHIHAHLAIANAYLAISTKEREQALALVEKHGLGNQFAAEFEQLRATFTRELTREQRLTAEWKSRASDLLSDERRAQVLSYLFQHGSINKSGYAELCSVGLATASKHLVRLAELGLLQQTGKGPSTRYVLP